MSNTTAAYDAAARVAYNQYAALTDPPWEGLSADEQARWLRVAQRTVKAFHAARKQEHRRSTQ